MKIGDSGPSVVLLQQKLNIKADGDYGPVTAAAVEAFQTANGLVADGIAGPLTLAKLGLAPIAPVGGGLRRICAVGPVTPGYDVSSYQGLGVHAQMKAIGKKFCIIKSSEYVVDSKYAAHHAEAKAQGMIVGSYDFFHPSLDVATQAKLMESVVGKLGAGDLGPAIDWETTDGVPAITDREEGYQFLCDVEQAMGKTPLVYGGPYFLQALQLDARFARFQNWMAQYGPSCPLVPDPWQGWVFWQWTDGGASNVDLNVFNGDLAALQALAGL